MAHDIIMPVLGMNQDTGTLVRWLRTAGDSVSKGDPVIEIATDKITVELEAPADGTLSAWLAAEGDEVPVGQAMAYVLAAGEALPQEAPAPAAAQPADPPSAPRSPDARVAASPVARRLAASHGLDLADIPAPGGRIGRQDVEAYLTRQSPLAPAPLLASPKARRLAREADVDLTEVPGSGPEGAVLAADFEIWMSRQSQPVLTAPATDTIVPSPKWQVMAQRLTECWQTVPHFYLSRTADATQLQAWRRACLEQYDQRVTVTDLLVKVLAASLRAHPPLNASWQENGTILRHREVNIGLAVAVADGLLVPVIRQADQRSVSQIAAERERLVAAAQADRLALADMEGGTFSLTNLGMFGVERMGPIIKPPEAAILGVGAVKEQVVPVEGQPAIRPMMDLTLGCDHRALEGATVSRFLQTLVAYLETPLLLLE